MREYLLLLPIIFIFHDMEEIVGFIWFFRKNPYLFERFPKVMKPYRGLTHEGFALGVYEEFIPFFGVSLLTYYIPCNVLYGLWFGVFMALTGHFLIHIGHTIYIRKYIPCVITSVISLPISLIILVKSARIIDWNVITVLSVIAALILMNVNLKMCHRLAQYVNKKIKEQEANGDLSNI